VVAKDTKASKLGDIYDRLPPAAGVWRHGMGFGFRDAFTSTLALMPGTESVSNPCIKYRGGFINDHGEQG